MRYFIGDAKNTKQEAKASAAFQAVL